MGWWQNVDKLYVRDVFWWGLKRAEERRRQREALARQEEQRQQERLNSVKTGLTTAAVVIAAAAPAAGVLPGGQQYGDATSGRDWSKVRVQAEKDRRSRDLESGTLDAGNRARGTNQDG